MGVVSRATYPTRMPVETTGGKRRGGSPAGFHKCSPLFIFFPLTILFLFLYICIHARCMFICSYDVCITSSDLKRPLRKGLSVACQWLTGQSQGCFCLRLFSAKITNSCHYALDFYINSDNQTQVLMLVGQSLHWQSHPPNTSFSLFLLLCVCASACLFLHVPLVLLPLSTSASPLPSLGVIATTEHHSIIIVPAGRFPWKMSAPTNGRKRGKVGCRRWRRNRLSSSLSSWEE